MKTYVIHHNDSDGRMSAAIVKHMIHSELVFIEAHDYYDTAKYVEDVNFGDSVIIVDFSLEVDVINELINRIGYDQIYWIDHHETAIKKYHDAGLALQGLSMFNEESPLAGCELVWQYFSKPNSVMPEVVKLVGDYDTWRYEDYEKSDIDRVLAFQYGIREYRTVDDYYTLLIESLSNSINPNIFEAGYSVLKYLESTRSLNIKRYGYELDFMGYHAYVINTPEKSSLAFQEKIKEYDICIVYTIDGSIISGSIYTHKSTGIFANKIAEKFGGGGHKGAAGFKLTLDKLSLLLPNNNVEKTLCFFDYSYLIPVDSKPESRPMIDIEGICPEVRILETGLDIKLSCNHPKREIALDIMVECIDSGNKYYTNYSMLQWLTPTQIYEHKFEFGI